MRSLHFSLTATLIIAGSLSRAYTQLSYNPYCNEVKYYYYSDGSSYYGELYNGISEGIGRVDYADGNQYIGSWKYHSPHGEGVMFLRGHAKKIRGIWEMGRLVNELPLGNSSCASTPITVAYKPQVKIWSMVVGVSQYWHLPSLRLADDDAYQVYSFLTSPAGGAIPSEQVRLLINESATRENILAAMRFVSSQANNDDVVIFYFSGHGLPDAFFPSDSNSPGDKLLYEEIVALLNVTNVRHKLVITDACHSGSIGLRKSPENTLIGRFNAAIYASGGTAFLSSPKCEEYSFENRGLRSGVFSNFLLRGIKGEADYNWDKVVTISELYDFVFRNIQAYTQNM